MAAKMYYDQDAEFSLLKGKTIAVIGYGSQGHAQAQNLRDSGCNVVVGQRGGSANYDAAIRDGFKPVSAGEAAEAGNLVNILLPDEVQGEIYVRRDQAPSSASGDLLLCSLWVQHIHFGQVVPPEGVDCDGFIASRDRAIWFVASLSKEGGALPDRDHRELHAGRKGAGACLRQGDRRHAGGCVADDVCGGDRDRLVRRAGRALRRRERLVKMAFETLTEAGYQPESAYFECLHELKLIVDLMYQGGLSYMRYSISNTAEYGDYTRGPRIVNEQTRAEMKKILGEIRSGQFAREWILENRANRPMFNAMRRMDHEHPVEQVGKRLRSLMPWIDAKDV